MTGRRLRVSLRYNNGGDSDAPEDILSGEYQAVGTNHNRQTYEKIVRPCSEQTVCIYYWDDRDGEHLSGWWFGKCVGSDEVWAHCENPAHKPPLNGWRVVGLEEDRGQELVVEEVVASAKDSAEGAQHWRLPPPWQAIEHEGGHYFWNPDTEESVWDPPEGSVPVNGAAKELDEAAHAKPYYWDPPPPWEVIPHEGSHYYWNPETEESQWEPPAGSVPTDEMPVAWPRSRSPGWRPRSRSPEWTAPRGQGKSPVKVRHRHNDEGGDSSRGHRVTLRRADRRSPSRHRQEEQRPHHTRSERLRDDQAYAHHTKFERPREDEGHRTRSERPRSRNVTLRRRSRSRSVKVRQTERRRSKSRRPRDSRPRSRPAVRLRRNRDSRPRSPIRVERRPRTPPRARVDLVPRREDAILPCGPPLRRGQLELSYKNQRLGDERVLKWCDGEGPLKLKRMHDGCIECVDFSMNYLTDEGVAGVIRVIREARRKVKRLMFFKNKLRAPSSICELLEDKECGLGTEGGPKELHLSDNELSKEFIEKVLDCLGKFKKASGPIRPAFWVRAERNWLGSYGEEFVKTFSPRTIEKLRRTIKINATTALKALHVGAALHLERCCSMTRNAAHGVPPAAALS